MHGAPGILPPRWKMVKVPYAEEQENWRVNHGGIWGVREAVDLLGLHLSAAANTHHTWSAKLCSGHPQPLKVVQGNAWPVM